MILEFITGFVLGIFAGYKLTGMFEIKYKGPSQ